MPITADVAYDEESQYNAYLHIINVNFYFSLRIRHGRDTPGGASHHRAPSIQELKKERGIVHQLNKGVENV